MWPDSDNETTHLFLVRHGATEANERRPYVLQGQRHQFSAKRKRPRPGPEGGEVLVENFHPGRVFQHAAPRRETAGEIARLLDLPPRTVEGIHEVNVGDWEGKSWNMIMEENETAYRAFIEDPGDTPYLGGESYRDVLHRAKPALEGLLEKHRGESLVVVAHNVVNRAYLADVLGLDLKRAKDIHQANCCINIIRRISTVNPSF